MGPPQQCAAALHRTGEAHSERFLLETSIVVDRLRDECLNEQWLISLADAKQTIGDWKIDYDAHRPHNFLGYMIPIEYARKGYNLTVEFSMLVTSLKRQANLIISLGEVTTSAI